MSNATLAQKEKSPSSLSNLWETLTKKPDAKAPVAIKRADLTFIMRNLATLVENGVSLPKALKTVSQEILDTGVSPSYDWTLNTNGKISIDNIETMNISVST